MSGIELANLILGAVPVVVTAVDLLLTGCQKSMIPFRKGRYVGMLTNCPLLQRQTYGNGPPINVHSGCFVITMRYRHNSMTTSVVISRMKTSGN